MKSAKMNLISGWTAVLKYPMSQEEVEMVRERIFMERMADSLTVSNDGTVVSLRKKIPIKGAGTFNENHITNRDVVDFTRMTCYLGLDFDPFYCMPFTLVGTPEIQDPTYLFSASKLKVFIKKLLE